MREFSGYTNTSKALLISSFQLANYEFFVDEDCTNMYLHKQHIEKLSQIRKFLAGVCKLLPAKTQHQQIKVLSIVYIYAANLIKLTAQELQDPNTKKDLQHLTESVKTAFSKR